MRNTYFQFKQFRVSQDKCAMKVTTDACIFGAWVPEGKYERMLDIGTGTGLLALMLAQKSDGVIDAVEVDEAAAYQAGENFKQSPWHQRLHIIHQDVLQFSLKKEGKYDLIVCNPPFFEGNLPSEAHNKNLAKHSVLLSRLQLCEVVGRLLKPDGLFYVLFPAHEAELFQSLAGGYGLTTLYTTAIVNNPDGQVLRTMTCMQRKSCRDEDIKMTNLYIRKDNGDYSEDFIQLLKPYYLYL